MNLIIIFIFALLVAKTNKEPETPYQEPPPTELYLYQQEYVDLAALRSVFFTQSVRMKFGDPRKFPKKVVGLCYLGDDRLIKIKPTYWDKASMTTKKVLVFHELTHCLCTRTHDFEDGRQYSNPVVERVFKDLNFFQKTLPGYMADGCPLSIMHPTVLDDDCMIRHEKEYLDEMFSRCDPY